MKSKSDKQSPLKAQPLQNPGKSTRRAPRRIVDELFKPYSFFAGFCVAIATMEWLRYSPETPYSPWFFSVIAAIFVGIAVYKICQIYPEYKNYRQDAEGEKTVDCK